LSAIGQGRLATRKVSPVPIGRDAKSVLEKLVFANELALRIGAAGGQLSSRVAYPAEQGPVRGAQIVL